MDSDAWETLLAIYSDELQRDILASLGRRDLPSSEAEDIQQETWTSAIEHISGFEGGEKLYHWLRVISLNHVRARCRKLPPISLDAAEAECEANGKTLDLFLHAHGLSIPSFEDELERQEQINDIGNALRSLKPQARALFVKRYLWQQKPRSLAQEYPSLSAHEISQKLFRARRQIRSRLGTAQNL